MLTCKLTKWHVQSVKALIKNKRFRTLKDISIFPFRTLQALVQTLCQAERAPLKPAFWWLIFVLHNLARTLAGHSKQYFIYSQWFLLLPLSHPVKLSSEISYINLGSPIANSKAVSCSSFHWQLFQKGYFFSSLDFCATTNKSLWAKIELWTKESNLFLFFNT